MNIKNLFKGKKKQSKEDTLELEKANVIQEIVKLKLQIGIPIEQIKKEFVNKGYPREFLDWILIRMKGGQKEMAKKPIEEAEEDEETELDEEEEELPEEEMEEEPIVEEKPVKLKPKVVPIQKKEVPTVTKVPQVTINDVLNDLSIAIQNLDVRVVGIEAQLFRTRTR